LQPARNPDLLPMPGPQKYAKVSRYFETRRTPRPPTRPRRRRVAEMAEKRKQTAAGIFTTGVTQSAIANTKGLFASHRQTRAEFSITILESDSSGWAKATRPISIASIQRRWLRVPAKNRSRRASQAKPRPESGP